MPRRDLGRTCEHGHRTQSWMEVLKGMSEIHMPRTGTRGRAKKDAWLWRSGLRGSASSLVTTARGTQVHGTTRMREMRGKPGLRVQQNSLLGLDGRYEDGPPAYGASEQVCGSTIIAIHANRVVRREMYDSRKECQTM